MGTDNCFVIAREGCSGGTGTLSLRLIKHIHSLGVHCVYICCENNDPKTYNLICAEADVVVCEADKKYHAHFERLKGKYSSFVCLTYSLEEYMAINALRVSFDSIKRVVYYVVHGYAFSIPPATNISIVKRLMCRVYNCLRYRRLVKTLLRNQSIIFMDEVSVNETSKALRLEITKSVIHLLPMRINDYDEEVWNTLTRHSPFTIGTMCRMEFPMKAYVIGLLKRFPLLLQKYDLKLIIVGDGPDRLRLDKEIELLPPKIRERIDYFESVSYTHLDDFYSQCDLVLGMGTVLLDSANHNVLSIPVTPYTYDLKVTSLFLENPDWLCVKGEEHDFEIILDSLLTMPQESFNQLVRKQYENVKSLYEINDFTHFLLNTEVGALSVSLKNSFLYDLLR